jgi:hypothetical protein
VLASTQLVTAMGKLAFESNDPNVRQQALAWMEQVPGTANPQALRRSVELVQKWLGSTAETPNPNGTTPEDPWYGSLSPDEVNAQAKTDHQLVNGVKQHLQNQASTNAINTPTDAPTRNSAAFVADAGANQVEIKQGGTVWDTFVQQKNSATGFQDWGEYKAAVAASNPGIKDLNKVGVGTVLMQPEKLANGSITYHYSNQVSVNTHAANGTYHMVVPNTEGGGQTVFTRTYDSQTAQYTVTQVQTNGAGQVVFNYQGQQSSLDAPLTPVSASVVSNQQTTTRNGVANLPANESSWRQAG